MVRHRIARSLGFALSMGLSVSLTGVVAAAESPADIPASSAAASGRTASVLLADNGSTNQWLKKQTTQKGRGHCKSKKSSRGPSSSAKGKGRPKRPSRTSPPGNFSTTT